MKNKKTPRKFETIFTMVAFIGLFIGMIVYFLLYVKNNEQTLVNNSYNSRTKLLALENTRGTIYDRGHKVLAETVTDANGKETREYPYDNLFAHAVGFASKGRTGIESSMNYYLINSNVSISDKVENDIAGKKNPGNDVYTTLDYELQKVANDSLGAFRGAVVVSNVKTGEIYACVSKPDFDPNTIVEDWDKYVNSSGNESVLVNRAMQGLYPPGSTFKILTALEYIKEHPDNYKDYSYTCNGSFTKDDIKIRCYHGSVHNTVDFTRSFAKSCNSSFANMGLKLDRNGFGETLNSMLYNDKLPLDCNYSVSKLMVDETVSDSDMAQISIGQGKATITPIQLNLITNAIANKGMLMKPYMVSAVTDAYGNIIQEYKPEEYKRLLTEEEAVDMTEIMEAVVEEGTGKRLQSDFYMAAGKTGSAEFNGVAEDSHAWFTGFAPVDDPQISVTIIVENVGSGGEYAVPIAKRIIDAYFGVY